LPKTSSNSRFGRIVKGLISRFITRLHNASIDFYVWLFRLKHKNVKLYILPMDKIWAEFQQPSVKKELGLTDYENSCVVRDNETFTMCSSKYIYEVLMHFLNKE
jgi:hypothetical protein